MKKLSLAMALIIALVCLIGCSKTEDIPTDPSESAQESTPESTLDHDDESSTPELSFDSLVEDAYSQEATYTSLDGEEKNISFSIPKINLESKEIEAINTEIYDTLYPLIQSSVSEIDSQGHPFTSDGITYQGAINGDILSLVILNESNPYTSGGTEYYVYNISVSAMGAVTKEAVIEQAGFSQEEYYERAEQALGSFLKNDWNSYNSETKEDNSFVTFFNDRLSRTISRENIEESSPYINESGQLCIAAKVYSLAAADYYWHDLNLEDFELVPDYAEPVQ